MSTPKIRPSDYPFASTPTATPRTDAAWRRYNSADQPDPQELAKEMIALETELACVKAECERIKVIATEQNDIAEQHRRELARLRAENDEMRVQIEAHKGGSCQCADDEACAHVRRAERAEAECLEQAGLLGKSGEREADLLGKLERLARDKARLDWLERRNNIAIDHSTWSEHMPLAGQPIIHLLEMDDDCEISLEKIATAPNLRAAIDAAKKEETK